MNGGIEKEITALRETLRTLRGPGGCPWDRQQALDDIISYLIDESYELLHAGVNDDTALIEEELGDVFFLVIFIHELILERRESSLAGIIAKVHEKIVSRHPHVFGGTSASDCGESLAEWERIKSVEKPADENGPVLSSLPSGLPPLRRAFSIQKKAAGAGFDWDDHHGVIEKLREEIVELEAAAGAKDQEKIKEEVGDLFFTVVNLARMLHVDSEAALENSSAKFIRRFNAMEQKVRSSGARLEDLELAELEKIWQDSK